MPDVPPTDRRIDTHTVDGELLTLCEPNGTQFDVILRAVRRAEGEPLDVRVVIELGWPTYDRTIDIFGFFHASEDVRGEGPPGGFIEGKRVQVEARLDDALAREHFASTDAAGVASRLLALSEAAPRHALLETEAWFALHVSQGTLVPEDAPAGASLREGYSTAWASAERVAR